MKYLHIELQINQILILKLHIFIKFNPLETDLYFIFLQN